MPASPGALADGSTHQSTLPYGVDPVPPCLPMIPVAVPGRAAKTLWGISGAAARPGGYRDGAEEAMTVPSVAIARTAVTASSLWIGPVITGTTSALPSEVTWALPGRTGWPRSPRTVPTGTPAG